MTEREKITGIHEAVRNGDLESIKEILCADPGEVNSRNDPTRSTPLHVAAECGHDDVAELLLSNDADVTAVNDAGRTSLFIAVTAGHVAIAELLLANGADVELGRHGYSDFLFEAVARRYLSILQLLLAKGGDAQVRDYDGRTLLHEAAEYNNSELVELLLDAGIPIDSKDEFRGKTPLHVAAGEGCETVVRLLLLRGAGANTKNNDGETPLHETTREDIVQALLGAGADPIAKSCDGCTPMLLNAEARKSANVDMMLAAGGILDIFSAVCLNMKEQVVLLLEAKPELLSAAVRGDPLFHWAVTRGSVEIVRQLAKKGVDLNAVSANGDTPLTRATYLCRQSIVRCLIAEGADVHCADSRHMRTPLHYAAAGGKRVGRMEWPYGSSPRCETKNPQSESLPIVEAFVEAGSEVNVRDRHPGATPLHVAASMGCKDIVEYLLAHGADLHAKDSLGNTLLHVAVTGGDEGVIRLLLESGQDVNARDNRGITPLHLAGMVSAEVLVGYGADVNAVDEKGNTPLHRSCDPDLISLLLTNGADACARNSKGETPLHRVCNSKDSVDLLLAKGADADAKCMSGRTPLFVAIQSDKMRIVDTLLAAGADPHIRDADGLTLLYFASHPRPLKVMERLMRLGVDVNAKTNRGTTPLHVAVKFDRSSQAEVLVAGGAIVTAQDDMGDTALHLSRSRRMVDLLLVNGAEVDARNTLGRTPLHAAMSHGSVDMVESLVAAGASINGGDEGGQTPLHRAVSSKRADKIKILLAKGALINAEDQSGERPLHKAVLHRGMTATAECLLDAGADINAPDDEGNTPLHRAILAGREGPDRYVSNKYMIKLLVAKGADLKARNRFGEKPIQLAKKVLEWEAQEAIRDFFTIPEKAALTDDKPDLRGFWATLVCWLIGAALLATFIVKGETSEWWVGAAEVPSTALLGLVGAILVLLVATALGTICMKSIIQVARGVPLVRVLFGFQALASCLAAAGLCVLCVAVGISSEGWTACILGVFMIAPLYYAWKALLLILGSETGFLAFEGKNLPR